MPIHALPVSIDYGREAATQPTAQVTVATPLFDINISPAEPVFQLPLLLVTGPGARVTVATVLRDGAVLRSYPGERRWYSGSGTWLDNDGKLAIAGQELLFAGDALTALSAGIGAAKFVVDVMAGGGSQLQTASAQVGYQQLLALLDTATGDAIFGPSPALWRELERQFAEAGDVATVLSSDAGVPLVQVQNAGVGALPPDGRVTIAAADVGTGLGQVPTTYATLSARSLLAHPSVFLRRCTFVRGAEPAVTAGFREQYFAPITDPALSPIAVFAAQRPATWSTWLLVVDGAARIATFAHDAARGLTRPRDLYADAIAPLIDGGGTLDGGTVGQLAALFPSQLDTADVDVIPSAGGYLRRMSWLTYARCLEYGDTTPGTYFAPVLEPATPEPPPIPDPPVEN